MKQLEMLKKAMAGKGLPYGWIYCFNEQCVVKEECVRFLSTRFLSEKRHSGNAVFPSAWRNGNCQYYEKLRIAKLAWGFDHLYRNVTLKDAPTLRCRLRGYLGSKGQYYRYKLGQLLLLPKQQLEINNDMHFQDPGIQDHPADIWVTIYKGGVIVPVIHTLLLTVLAMTIERWLALKTATGTGALPKFVANIKSALNANDFAKAEQLCNKQRGTVANVVMASLNAYKSMESGANASLKKAQKVAKIQQAHEEATQLEMPTLTMNLPIIATIVTLGTLTGLLGTVTGMIKSFQAMGEGGGADSAALSVGISEALINTAFGILTSWCAVVSYNTFTNKVDKLTYALDEVGYSIAQTYEANHAEEA